MEDRWAHICSAAIDRPAADAMAFLLAPENLASWAVGLGDATVRPDGTVEGAFPETGEPIRARIDADPVRGTILFHLGPDPGALVSRIMVRVVPGGVLERDPQSCVVSLIAWRQAGMDDARWAGLRAGHESEIQELKRLIEATAR